MLSGLRSSLELRMVFLAGTGLLIAFALFAGLSTWVVDEGTNRTLEERQVLARASADRVAHLLEENLNALQGVSFVAQVGSRGSDLEALRRALHETYLRTIFTDGVYLLDAKGQVLIAEPADLAGDNVARLPYVRRALEGGKPVVTDVYLAAPSGKPVFSALIPVHSDLGEIVGLLGGDVNPTDRRIQQTLYPIAIGSTGYAQLVDSAGNVFAGPRAGQPSERHQSEQLANIVQNRQGGTGTCHGCHQSGNQRVRRNEVIGFAPVGGAPWSVIVGQAEEEALFPSHRLRQIILLVGVPLYLLSLAVAWAMARSVVRPLTALARSAEGIASGDLSSPVPQAGEDEVGRLARTFEVMRLRLNRSLKRIQGWNADLEERVRQRTLQLQEQEHVRRELLRKLIAAQEEERRRIARELHDDTSQFLAALIVALDTAAISVELPEPGRQRLAGVKSLAVQILDGVHKLIYDLRPSLLDDLGLVAALRWYAETRLQAAGVNVSVETTGGERRLPPEVETTLFRILQEAVTNVAKHACAETAVVRLEIRDHEVVAEVEDDGQGFDPAQVKPEHGKMQGLGLLGMEERIGLWKGTMSVTSRPGHGTRLRFEMPIEREGERNEANSCALGR